jgi:hypothetical protein
MIANNELRSVTSPLTDLRDMHLVELAVLGSQGRRPWSEPDRCSDTVDATGTDGVQFIHLGPNFIPSFMPSRIQFALQMALTGVVRAGSSSKGRLTRCGQAMIILCPDLRRRERSWSPMTPRLVTWR